MVTAGRMGLVCPATPNAKERSLVRIRAVCAILQSDYPVPKSGYTWMLALGPWPQRGILEMQGLLMTVTIDLSPEKEAAFKAQAAARGLSLEQWMLAVAEQQLPPVSIVHLQKTNPEEWARQFRAWADSHDPNTPVLSDEAMSRESIYPD